MLKIEKNKNWLEQAAEKFPDKTAFIFNDETISYKTFLQRLIDTEFHLGSLKIKKKDLVAVASGNTLDFVILIFALWRKGALPVLINPNFRTEEINSILEELKPELFLVHKNSIDLLSISFNNKIVFPFNSGNYRKKGNPQKLENNDEAVVVYTSGSTDKPKGVVLTFDNLYESAVMNDSVVRHDEKDLWMASLPFYHIGGFSIIVRALLTCTTILIPDSLKTEILIESYKKYKPTLFSLVQAQLKDFIDRKVEVNKNLKFIFLGGGHSSEELVKESINAGWKIVKVYGSSETSSMVAALTPEQIPDKANSSGKAFAGTKIEIVNDEIIVSGPTVFKKYHNDEKLTNSRKRNNKYFTGDIGYLDEDGFLFVTGRKDEMIISGGENINPTEIKRTLEEHPLIEESFVFGLEDDKWNQSINAVVVSDEELKEEEIKKWLAGKLASYKIPKKFFFLDELPKTQLGKIEKQKILKILQIEK